METRRAYWRLGCIAVLLLIAAMTATTPLQKAHAAEQDGPKTVPLLIIVAEFGGNDEHAAVPYDTEFNWGQAIFGEDESLASYYLDMSLGAFTFAPATETCEYGDSAPGMTNVADQANDGIVHISLDEPHEAWGLVNEKTTIAQDFGAMVLRAFQKASDYVDFATYDTNADGVLTTDELAVCLCVAGYDASPLDDPGRTDIPLVWPHAGVLATSDSAEYAADGVQLDSYIAIAEHLWREDDAVGEAQHEPIGILYHELGHHLGLPDLYPMNSESDKGAWGDYRVGWLSLMDNGGWAEVLPQPKNDPERRRETSDPDEADAEYQDDVYLEDEPEYEYDEDGEYVEYDSDEYDEAYYEGDEDGATGDVGEEETAFNSDELGYDGEGSPAGEDAADGGPQQGTGERVPTALDAWSRYVLNWALPTIATQSGDYIVSSQLSPSGYQSLLVPTSDPDEYYLIENRIAEGHDAALASGYEDGASLGGLVVWHVDKALYRRHGLENEINSTDHAPGVMELFFEQADEKGHSTDWQNTRPDTQEPFFSSVDCKDNLGDAKARVTLPLYNGEDGGLPRTRVNSNVTLQFADAAARNMTVHVEFENDIAGTSEHRCGADEARVADALPVGDTSIGQVAASALLRETGAQVAIVDRGSIQGEFSEGDITLAQAESVLPSDSTIVSYQLSGTDIKRLAEQSYARYVAAKLSRMFGHYLPDLESDVLDFAGISYTVGGNGKAAAAVSSAEIDGQPLTDDGLYSVAMTRRVANRDQSLSQTAPFVLTLWGYPSDALRSFIQQPDWESAAATAAGVHRYAQ